MATHDNERFSCTISTIVFLTCGFLPLHSNALIMSYTYLHFEHEQQYKRTIVLPTHMAVVRVTLVCRDTPVENHNHCSCKSSSRSNNGNHEENNTSEPCNK